MNTDVNQVAVGGRTVTQLANATLDATSTDAVTGQQLFATNTNVATNSTAIATLNTTVTNQATSIATLNTTVASQATTIADHTTQISALDTAVQTQATQISDLDTRVGALEALAGVDFGAMDERIGHVDDRAASGSAVAIAMGGATFLPDMKFNLSGNVGFYRGAYAGALNVNAVVNRHTALNAGLGVGFNKRGGVGGRVGFTVGW